MQLARSRLAGVLIAMLCACSSPARPSQPARPAAPAVKAPPLPAPPPASAAQGADGYTTFKPSADTRIVYVSSSRGLDSHDGLSPESPKASLEAGLALLRSHHPDWLLLERGDVWNAPRGFMVDKSGRSPAEPLLVGAYDRGPRPEVRGTIRIGSGWRATFGVHHVVLASIHIHLNHRDPKDPAFNPDTDSNGLYIGEGGDSQAPIAVEDVLVEDVLVNFGSVIVQAEVGTGGQHRVRNVRFRRTVVKDAYQDARAFGLFVHGVDGLLVDECAIDHVQQLQVPRAKPTGQDHSIYLQSDTRNAIVRRSLFMRVPDGPMMRSGGVFEDNVVARAACGNLQGFIAGGTEPVAGGVSSRVVGNAFLETSGPALVLGNMARGEVSDNLFLRSATRERAAIELHASTGIPEGMRTPNVGVHNVALRGNVVHGHERALWLIVGGAVSALQVQGNTFVTSGAQGAVIESVMALGPELARFANNRYHGGGEHWFRIGEQALDAEDWASASGDTGSAYTAVEFVDPARDLASYNASLGGPASLEAFAREVHLQAQGNYREAYTAQAVLRYLRAGFQRR